MNCLPDKDHIDPSAGEHECRMEPRAGEREDRMGPRAGEHEGRMEPKAGAHEGHMGPRAGGHYVSLLPFAPRLAVVGQHWETCAPRHCCVRLAAVCHPVSKSVSN